MATQVAFEHCQDLPTSGARAVCRFDISSQSFLAVPQLAKDYPTGLPDMTKGDSNVPTLVFILKSGKWQEFQKLPSPGGEDAETFEIDGRHFLAVASLRSGDAADNYNYTLPSTIYEFRDGRFEVFQQIVTFAAKQWRFFNVGEERFLAVAQGARVEPELMPADPPPSEVYKWNGHQFDKFQSIPAEWGYNWETFSIDGSFFLAHADHLIPSTIYKWDGKSFAKHQELQGKSGRALYFFEDQGQRYLLFARLQEKTALLRWNGSAFEQCQILSGAGGREFKVFEHRGRKWIFQVNFISGTREAPTTALQSFLYYFEDGRMTLFDSLATSAATDASIYSVGQELFLALSQSLAPSISFTVPTRVFKLNLPPPAQSQPQSSIYQDPAMTALFHTYTTNPAGVGADLRATMARSCASNPLIVASSTTLALFPGDGGEPSVQGFRFSTRGFKELAGVSHLGPALGSIVKMRMLDPSSSVWRDDAKRLLKSTRDARSANSAEMWVDKIQAEAYKGREVEIAAMLDYACAVSARFLETILQDESRATPEYLRAAYLEGTDGSLGTVVPFNYVMLATFFLVGMDISYRIAQWFHEQRVDWERAEVLVCGQQGRPTAGVTISSNSVAQMILGASGGRLPSDRLYIAPHAAAFKYDPAEGTASLKKYEPVMRELWAYTRGTAELGPVMFSGHPGYESSTQGKPVITEGTKTLPEMPDIMGLDDMFSMVARLRLVMEDARQLLSGCLADIAVKELHRTGNDPQQVVVPGLSGYHYPTGLDDSPASATTWANTSRVEANHKEQYSIKSMNDLLRPDYQWLPVSDSGKLAFWTDLDSNTQFVGKAPILWVHGLPNSSISWAPQYYHFKRLGYPQLFVDLRGYGKSSKLPQKPSSEGFSVTELYCEDILALLDHLKIERAVFVGFASAGHVGLRFAAKHPQYVDKLVVLNGSPKFRAAEDWPLGFSEDAIQHFIQPAPGETSVSVDTLAKRILDPYNTLTDMPPAKAVAAADFMRKQAEEAGVETLLGFFENISRDDDRALLPHIVAPTLIVSGCKGKEVSVAVAEYMNRQIPTSYLFELPGADHFIGLTRPEIVNAAIEDFLL